MPRIKLTEKAIAKLRAPDPSKRQVLHWDTELRGFAVLCSGVTNVKTFIVQRDMPDGKTRRVTIAAVNETSLEEARERAREVLVDLRRGIDPKARRAASTLREVLDMYRRARDDLRSRSVEQYEMIERYLSEWMDRPMQEITREMVEARHREIAVEVTRKRRARASEVAKKYRALADKVEQAWPEAAARHRAVAEQAEQRQPPSGHATANGVMRVLRLLWNFAADRVPELGPNPVRLKRQWFDVPRKERLVRAADLPRFYRAIMALENKVARDYLLLLLFSGLRRSEAAGLRWEDIDLQGRVIRIPAARTKTGRMLDLPMTDLLHDMLVARRSLGKEEFVFPANSKSGFITEPKFPLSVVARESGVAVSAHDLRRSYVTVASRTEITGRDLKALVNHSLGGDVTAGYDQITVADLREPAQRVCDRMKQLCGVAPVTGENVASLSAGK